MNKVPVILQACCRVYYFCLTVYVWNASCCGFLFNGLLFPVHMCLIMLAGLLFPPAWSNCYLMRVR